MGARRIRLLDVVVSALALVGTLPLWPAIALAIKAESRGPVLYRGERLGRHEVVFAILKFRTMRQEQDERRPITIGRDERVTRVGRILRATKLDELPQLLNVLRGDMSLVGPRPEAPAYLDRYPLELREIFRFRPGITSPASLVYLHEEVLLAEADGDPEEFYVTQVLPRKIALDLQYCRQRTVVSDLAVLARTIRLVAGR